MAPHRRVSADDRLVCADIFGAFGVTATDVRRTASGDDTLERALADVLATPVDRTTVLRRTIARSGRGLACAARYSRADLERELAAVFEAIGWSLAVTRTRSGPKLTATDPRGRRREATIAYPETPLATDNLPAVLWAIDDEILAGTDARFVLLSSGVDRWRAALVADGELERLRDRYGPRIDAFDRPLLPADGLEAYVPAASDGRRGAGVNDPWPPWALEDDAQRASDPASDVGSLIDEAEPSARPESGALTAPADERPSDATTASASTAASERPTGSTASEGAATAAPSSEIDGFELRGSPAVSRRRDGDTERDSATAAPGRSGTADGSSRDGRSTSADEGGTGSDGFGTLSGTSRTVRVGNDSFGTDAGWRAEDDRYRALGAALDAGGDVSVRGLLEDDDFLPELPAAGSAETRIEFADGCAPVDVPDATAAAERSGFEWVDSGSLETTRVSNG